MYNLEQLKNKFETFSSLTWVKKRMFAEAYFLTGISRIVIILIPFNIIKKNLGIHKEETPFESDSEELLIISKVAWAVKTASKNTPWQSKCFVQALTAQKMLTKRRIASTIYFGLKKEDKEMSAHAWLRSGSIFVTGGINKDGFKEISKFGKFI